MSTYSKYKSITLGAKCKANHTAHSKTQPERKCLERYFVSYIISKDLQINTKAPPVCSVKASCREDVTANEAIHFHAVLPSAVFGGDG